MAAMRREFALVRGDIKVLTAIFLLHEETLIRVLEQITAMVGQNAWIVDRLRTIEEGADRLEQHE
jgi:hypothetical protein